MIAKIQDQIGTVNPADCGMTQQSSHPNHRHAVRRRKERTIKNIAKSGIALRLAHAVNIRDRDVAAFAFSHRLEQKLARALLIENANIYAEDFELLDLHCCRRA